MRIHSTRRRKVRCTLTDTSSAPTIVVSVPARVTDPASVVVSPASRGTHCTCSRVLAASQGIAIAVLAYWVSAAATKPRAMIVNCTPGPSSSPVAVTPPKSKSVFGAGLVVKVWTVAAEEDGVDGPGADGLSGGGRNDQEDDGIVYKSRREALLIVH